CPSILPWPPGTSTPPARRRPKSWPRSRSLDKRREKRADKKRGPSTRKALVALPSPRSPFDRSASHILRFHARKLLLFGRLVSRQPDQQQDRRRKHQHPPVLSQVDLPVCKQEHERPEPQRRHDAAQIPVFGLSPRRPKMEQRDGSRQHPNQNRIHFFTSFSLWYLSRMSLAVSRSMRESTASPLIKAAKGSSAFWSFSSIFWISLSSRSRTVGYDTWYSRAISFSEPDFSTKFFR